MSFVKFLPPAQFGLPSYLRSLNRSAPSQRYDIYFLWPSDFWEEAIRSDELRKRKEDRGLGNRRLFTMRPEHQPPSNPSFARPPYLTYPHTLSSSRTL